MFNSSWADSAKATPQCGQYIADGGRCAMAPPHWRQSAAGVLILSMDIAIDAFAFCVNCITQMAEEGEGTFKLSAPRPGAPARATILPAPTPAHAPRAAAR